MKFVLVGACCLALSAAAGCGSSSSRDAASDDSVPTTSVKTPTNAVDPERAEVNTSWMMLVGSRGNKSASPQSLYTVFGRKQTDDEAQLALRLAADSPCTGGLPENRMRRTYGKPIPEKARFLLRDFGPGYDNLVAMPTTTGLVYVGVNGGATCTRPADNGLIVAAGAYGDAATVFGMVDDRVRSVDVIADGQTHRAKLGENGFAATLPSGAVEHLDKLVLHRADGSKTELPLG
jgi:hypothetical protein